MKNWKWSKVVDEMPDCVIGAFLILCFIGVIAGFLLFIAFLGLMMHGISGR